jgi:uncharacterized small protein (DUF1192 family)
MSRAEYMREYRAKQKLGALVDEVEAVNTMAEPRIAELEEEVRHLKAELAKRVTSVSQYAAPGFNSRPFTPVPRERDKAKGK